MPTSGAAAVIEDPGIYPTSVTTTFGLDGLVQLSQVTLAVPQHLIASGANTNSANAVTWGIWNDRYTNSILLTSTTASTSVMTETRIETIITGGTSTTMTITSNQAWSVWNQQMQTAILSAVSSHVGQLINQGTTNSINAAIWTNWNYALQNASPQQIAHAQQQVQAQQAQQRQHWEAVQAERSLAEKRAEKLLQETLSPAQREELASKGFFTLTTIAKSGEERIYRIKRGRSRNVEQVDATGRRIKTLCAHPVAAIPDADTMVAQKLMLETPDMQEEFLRIANHS